MRKTIAFLTCVMLIVSLMSPVFAAFESSSSELIPSTTQLKTGDTLTVTATLNNTDAIRFCTVLLTYDQNALEFIDGSCLIADASFASVSQRETTNDGVFPVGTAMMESATVVSGDIFVFNFKVKDTAATGAYTITNKTAVGTVDGSYITATGTTLSITHVHTLSGGWVQDDSTCHMKQCVLPGCEHVESQLHRFSPWQKLDAASHKRTCSVATCAYADVQPHAYDRQMIADIYRADENTYYYSCICGDKGVATFEGQSLFESSNSTLTASATQLKPGDTFSVTASLTNTEAIRVCTILVNYDRTALEFVDGASLLTGTSFANVSQRETTNDGVFPVGTAMMESATGVSGDVFVFNFKVKDTATGNFTITHQTAIGAAGGQYIRSTGTAVSVIHEHTVSDSWVSDGVDGHKRICTFPECEYEQPQPHSFGAWEMLDETDHKRVCSVSTCGYADVQTHIYNQRIAADAYKAGENTYYYSCVCGAKDTKTFDSAHYGNSSSALIASADRLNPGDAFTVTVNVTNDESVKICTVIVFFDDTALEFVDGAALVPDAMFTNVKQYVADGKTCVSGTTMRKEFAVISGDVYTFNFKVKDDVVFKTYEFTPLVVLSSGEYITATGTAVSVVHKHILGDDWVQNDASSHKKVCVYPGCDYTQTQSHSFGDWEKVDENTHKRICSVATCACEDVQEHIYDQMVQTDDYKASPASCTAKATYYYSCTCGAKGTTTYAFGEILPHTYDETVWEKDEEYHWHTCICGVKSEARQHNWDDGVITSEPSAQGPGIKTFTCTDCGQTRTEEVVKPGDINGNDEVTTEDVVALLLHVAMPDLFPINVPADYTGDDLVSTDDVIRLLLHVSMPDLFPLEV